MSKADIIQHPFMTAFCRFGVHQPDTPNELCPVVIKHDRTAKTWTCSCTCHTPDQIDAVVNPTTHAGWSEYVASNDNGGGHHLPVDLWDELRNALVKCLAES